MATPKSSITNNAKPISPLLVLAVIFLLGIAVRSVALRFDGSFDPDSHFHARMADEIVRTHTLPTWDPLSLQGRVYSYPSLLHIAIAIIAILTQQETLLVLKYLGVLVGALFGVSVFLLARHLSRSPSIAVWAALFASLSTVAVWRTSGFTRPDGVALTLIPLLLYLWLTRREKAAFVLSLVMVLLHPLSAVMYALLLVAWVGYALFTRRPFSWGVPLALIGMLIVFFLWIHSIGLPLSNYASKVSLEASELVQFTVLGILLFFPLSWFFWSLGLAKGKPHGLLMVWMALSFGLGALGMRMVAYFVPFFSIVAGYGMNWVLAHMLPLRRGVALVGVFTLILGCATIWVLMEGVHPYVKSAEKPAIAFLGDTASAGSSVLTMWDMGHVLAYYTHLPMVIDGYFEFAHELEQRNDAMKTALATSRCSTFVGALDQFHARYYFLPADELTGTAAKYGVLELERCDKARLLFSSDGARVYERVQ